MGRCCHQTSFFYKSVDLQEKPFLIWALNTLYYNYKLQTYGIYTNKYQTIYLKILEKRSFFCSNACLLVSLFIDLYRARNFSTKELTRFDIYLLSIIGTDAKAHISPTSSAILQYSSPLDGGNPCFKLLFILQKQTPIP